MNPQKRFYSLLPEDYLDEGIEFKFIMFSDNLYVLSSSEVQIFRFVALGILHLFIPLHLQYKKINFTPKTSWVSGVGFIKKCIFHNYTIEA